MMMMMMMMTIMITLARTVTLSMTPFHMLLRQLTVSKLYEMYLDKQQATL